ncbi:hypothetical protein Q5752_004250 [Cryptotrichosporon argae]
MEPDLSPPPVLLAPAAPLTPPPSTTGLPSADLTLAGALGALVTHLLDPLIPLVPSASLAALRAALTARLDRLFAPTWDAARPDAGSGFRSLICAHPHGLPRALREAAADAGIDEAAWRAAIARRSDRADDEWEAWCDPGCVSWRWGPWEYDEPGYDAPRAKEYPQTVWSGAAPLEIKASTPARPSHAIPIRAPSLQHIPPTPVASDTPSCLSTAAPTTTDSGSASASPVERASSTLPPARPVSPTPSDASSTASLSPSHASTASDASNTYQLVTPSTESFALPALPDKRGRTPSATSATSSSSATDATKPAAPTVTPYDGGNVTVVGGGTKLGATPSHSRASSLFGGSRGGGARSRSPSISAGSRALGNAVGANSNGAGAPGAPLAPRKTRTRRRIHPTYLGPFGQPGVGGPVPSAFGYAPKPIPYTAVAPGMSELTGVSGVAAPAWPSAQPSAIGLALPPLHGKQMASQMGMRPQSLGMLRRA